MFYILNFADHSFQFCSGVTETKIAIQVIIQTGTNFADLEIIDCSDDRSRMSVVEFGNRFWEE